MRPPKSESAATRNPDRTSARILAAALTEFAAHGFAGARVDAIARRAGANKRMLYHYFKNKEGLFRAVLRKKIADSRKQAETLSGDPGDNLPFWFTKNCRDPQWVRLLEWEALQSSDRRVIDEKQRRAVVKNWRQRVRQRQARGQWSKKFDARHLMLVTRSLTMFPVAFPQITRLITGRSVSDPKFQRAHAEFLKQFAAMLRPKAENKKTWPSSSDRSS